MYVVIEGIDGCGKNVQAELLRDRVAEEFGGDPLLVAEPDEEMAAGKLLRDVLGSGEFTESYVGLFLANRISLQVRKVGPVRRRGTDVVSARSFVSTLVYQQDRWSLEWLFNVHRELPEKPDLVVLLDVPAVVGMNRIRGRCDRTEHYEKLDVLRTIRARYVELFNEDVYKTGPKLRNLLSPRGRTVVIDGRRSIEEVSDDVWRSYLDARKAASRSIVGSPDVTTA